MSHESTPTFYYYCYHRRSVLIIFFCSAASVSFDFLCHFVQWRWFFFRYRQHVACSGILVCCVWFRLILFYFGCGNLNVFTRPCSFPSPAYKMHSCALAQKICKYFQIAWEYYTMLVLMLLQPSSSSSSPSPLLLFFVVDNGDGAVGCTRFCAAFSYSRENVFHLYFAKYKTQLTPGTTECARRQSKRARRTAHIAIVKY